MKLAWYGCTSLVCTLALSVVATTLEAQAVRFSLGGGLSIPTGGFANVDNAGWHVLGAAVASSPIPNLAFRVEGMYSVTPHKGFASDHTRIGGGSASVLYRLNRAGPNLRPYLLTGLGYYDVTTTATGTPSTSRSAIAWSGGGGLAVLGLGPAIGFVEARYLTIRTSGAPTNLFPVTLGLVFGTR
jgi:Outer membrane protein beta-barrel domain